MTFGGIEARPGPVARGHDSYDLSDISFTSKKTSACHGATQASLWHELGFGSWRVAGSVVATHSGGAGIQGLR
jgi:hypothetical protein